MNNTLYLGDTGNYFNLVYSAGFESVNYRVFEKYLEDEYNIKLIGGFQFRATDETKLTLFI